MREADRLYDVAFAKAWVESQGKLDAVAQAAPGMKLEVLEVHYDRLAAESLIEELPDQPKSSRPEAVEVAVRLRIRYALH